MPCTCDDYYDRDDVEKAERARESEHERRCHAQSLVNKLALILEKNQIRLPDSIMQNIEYCRQDLLTHKREELERDISLKILELKNLENRIKQIGALGGIVPQTKDFDAAGLKAEIAGMRAVTDSELLGS